MQEKLPLLILVGPTAVGKTRMAFELFNQFNNIEIISADSRQIFRYMDIGTAKPSIDELKKYPHHCIDIKDPDEYFSAGEFGRLARNICEVLTSKNKLPLVVGGSGLYIQALVEGLFEMGARDPNVKKNLEETARSEGLPKLYEQLAGVDPEAASKIHHNDKQRILRALEVYQVTGEPISQLRDQPNVETGIEPIYIGLNRNRSELYEIINMRVDMMIDSGLVDEVKNLRDKKFNSDLQSQRTVGYAEIHSLLDSKIDKKTAIDLIKQNTRRFAKRQLTWFTKYKQIHWLSINTEHEWLEARNYIAEQIKNLK